MSGVGQVAEAMWQACGVAEAPISEEASVQSQVEGKMHMLAIQAEASISCAIGEMSQQSEQGLDWKPFHQEWS